ncbi:MAG: SNF2 helicase associated domain-containing protein [Anaerovoracaceae bacterium]
MLTTTKIKKLANSSAYQKGMQIRYSKKRILDFQVERKTQYSRRRGIGSWDLVTARVRGSNGEVYDVELEYADAEDSFRSCSCDCLAFENYEGLCKHCVAVALMYADWQVKQKLYGEEENPPASSVLLSGSAPRWLSDEMDLEAEDDTEDFRRNPVTSAGPIRQGEPVKPREATSSFMKALLEKQTRRRTAPVTEAKVHGKVTLEPALELRFHQDTVTFRLGSEKMYVMKDMAQFAMDVMAEREHSYGKSLSFTHSMDSFAPESLALVQFILHHFQTMTDYRSRNMMEIGQEAVCYMPAQRSVPVTGQELEELIDACGSGPLLVCIEDETGMSVQQAFYLTEGWPSPLLTLQGEYEDGSNGEDSDDLTGIRGETGQLVVRRGSRYLFAFQDGRIYKTPLRGIHTIEDWLLQLAPRRRSWAHATYVRGGRNESRKNADAEKRTFFIERSDVPAFCRELLPQLKKVFDVLCVDFAPEEYVVPAVKFRFYLDSPEKDIVTCRAEAVYNDSAYPLYTGENAGVEAMGQRDLMEELAASQVMKGLLPLDGGQGQCMVAGDEDRLYAFLTEGIPSLQNLGAVFVSDALRRLEVRPAPKVSVGVSLSGDLLQLSMEADGFSRQELAEILSRYDRRKKYHRLKNGAFVQMDGEELEALAEMEQGLGLTEKQLAKEVVELPRFRALYLDSQMREKAALPVERSRDFRALVRNMKTIEDNDFEVPESLKGVLRGYQKRGFLWLKTLASGGFGGILADDMGLGKTLQVIAFLLSEAEGQAVGQESAHAVGRPKTALIVCPASLVYNWENEIHRFAPQLPVQVIAGTAAERAALLEPLAGTTSEATAEPLAGTTSGTGRPLVLITSYELLRRDIERYQNIDFSCQVIDEAQYIKNHGTKAAHAVKAVKAGFRIALTGTPIENRLSELWSIFDYLMPGFLYSYEQFRKRIEKPVISGQDEAAMAMLQKMISPFVLRRLKKDVLHDLPDKIEENTMTRLEGEQRELYEAQAQALKLTLENQSEEEFRQSKITVLSQLTRLRQICCDPSLVYEGYRGPAAKVDLCMEMVESGMEGGHKMLLFSQFTSMLEILETRLQNAGIAYYKLTGATPKEERIRLVEAFNREGSQVPVFLISLKAGGTGLNLTAADMVLHFDPWWNLAAQNQATDRAHRIGQRNVVNVYKLIAKDTIEENILRLQERKAQLADQVLSGEGISTGSFSREELLEILG